jgi:TonB family protein
MNASAEAIAPEGVLENEDAAPGASERGLLGSFAIASLIVIVGVLASWVAVKRAGVGEDSIVSDLTLDDLPTALMEEAGGAFGGVVERGDAAFAAGRVMSPRFDNALYFYESALDADPSDSLALAGMERVELWLDGQLTNALAQQDFDRADQLASVILEMRPDDAALAGRMASIGRIRDLLSRGDRELGGGRFAAAAATYRELISIDRANEVARAGLRSAVAALVNAGMAAANEGDLDTARARLADARAADSTGAGIATLAERIETVGSAPVVVGPAELAAQARASIEAGRLFGVDSDDAFAHIAVISRGWPGDPVIGDLRREAVARLVELGREAVDANDPVGMNRVVDRADDLGIERSAFGDLGDEIAYRTYMASFGTDVGRMFAMSELTPLAQQAPTLTRRAQRAGSGYVDVAFTVDENGRVTDPDILASSAEAFEAPSLQAIVAWRFEPVRIGGRVVPARSVMRFSFVN